MFLISFIIAFCLLYLGLTLIFPLFFTGVWPIKKHWALWPLVLIIFATIIIFSVNSSIANPLFANRFQHAFGGGFLAFFVCFLAMKKSGIIINRFQFFCFSFLVVIALGVASEILEYFLQNYFSFYLAETINDTWLDLISNSTGIIAASLLLVPFAGKSKKL